MGSFAVRCIFSEPLLHAQHGVGLRFGGRSGFAPTNPLFIACYILLLTYFLCIIHPIRPRYIEKPTKPPKVVIRVQDQGLFWGGVWRKVKPQATPQTPGKPPHGITSDEFGEPPEPTEPPHGVMPDGSGEPTEPPIFCHMRRAGGSNPPNNRMVWRVVTGYNCAVLGYNWAVIGVELGGHGV